MVSDKVYDRVDSMIKDHHSQLLRKKECSRGKVFKRKKSQYDQVK